MQDGGGGVKVCVNFKLNLLYHVGAVAKINGGGGLGPMRGLKND